MAQAAPHPAHRILAFHGVLLVIVLIAVAAASAHIYQWTRDDAKEQARIRQELLAEQTGRGIQTFYESILRDLGWIQLNPRQGRGLGTNPNPGRGPANLLGGNGQERMDETVIRAELGGRVADLFAYDKQTTAVQVILPQGSKLAATDFSPDMLDWLRQVDSTKVSRLMELKGQGVSLVAASFGRNDPEKLLVAVVPAEEIHNEFLRLLTEQNSAGVSLVDSGLRVVTSTNPKLAGADFSQFQNADVTALIREYQKRPKVMTRIFEQPVVLGAVDMGPRMVTLAPVSMAEEHWILFNAQPLGNIDAAIDPLFKRTVYWAVFMAAAITAVLVSTAVQMIRWQSRFERERRRVLEREIMQARRIQQQWLPEISSAPAGIDVAAINQPANHISGDFYNWFELPDGRPAIVIGDVTGHGMTAAFLMATTQLLVRNILARTPDPGAAMEEVNRQLCTQMFRGQFVTMLILALDLKKKQIEMASAGHPAPLLICEGATDAVKALDAEAQLVLGVERDVKYPTQRFPLEDARGILLYTDGVIDADGPDEQRFGLRRLVAALQGSAAARRSAGEMIEAVTDSVRQFRGTIELEDDLTLVAIHFHHAAARMRLAS